MPATPTWRLISRTTWFGGISRCKSENRIYSLPLPLIITGIMRNARIDDQPPRCVAENYKRSPHRRTVRRCRTVEYAALMDKVYGIIQPGNVDDGR
jgi:hypothetical protein